jgi:hypothetical protein
MGEAIKQMDMYVLICQPISKKYHLGASNTHKAQRLASNVELGSCKDRPSSEARQCTCVRKPGNKVSEMHWTERVEQILQQGTHTCEL